MSGLISGVGSSAQLGLFGGLTNAVSAMASQQQTAATDTQDAEDAEVTAVEASADASAGETTAAQQSDETSAASAQSTQKADSASDVSGDGVALRAGSDGDAAASGDEDALAKARAKAISTQESFTKSLLLAQMAAGPDEDGLAQRLRQGAESYANASTPAAEEGGAERTSVAA